MREKVDVSNSIKILNENLNSVARVAEWASVMGYDCPKRFSRRFQRHYSERPQKVMEFVRVKSITRQLRQHKWSNFEIARAHGLADEIALNKFVNYHLGCSPTHVKQLPAVQLRRKLNGMNALLNGENRE